MGSLAGGGSADIWVSFFDGSWGHFVCGGLSKSQQQAGATIICYQEVSQGWAAILRGFLESEGWRLVADGGLATAYDPGVVSEKEASMEKMFPLDACNDNRNWRQFLQARQSLGESVRRQSRRAFFFDSQWTRWRIKRVARLTDDPHLSCHHVSRGSLRHLRRPER
jgi:hypothetical protein